MYLADYHVHSACSPDGRDTMAELAETAAGAGFQELCFTDHVEVVQWGTNVLRQDFDWAPMARQFARAQDLWGDRLTLRLGAELGEAPMDFALTERLMAEAPPLDFVIGSIHSLSEQYDSQDLYFLREDSEAQCREEIADYLEQVRRLAKWGRFSVLGHLTLPLRYMNEDRGFHVSFDGFEAEVEEVFRLLIENGCGIEVNTNRGNDPLPGEKWLRLYRRLGGELVTLGSDAHRTEHVGRAVRERQELLRQCGFRRFCTFDRRAPVWHEL